MNGVVMISSTSHSFLDPKPPFGVLPDILDGLTNSSPRIMFGWLLILAILELGFTVDTFQYLQRKNAWNSTSQRQSISFLLFSSIRSVLLAAVYLGSHFANKWFKSLHHTVRSRPSVPLSLTGFFLPTLGPI